MQVRRPVTAGMEVTLPRGVGKLPSPAAGLTEEWSSRPRTIVSRVSPRCWDMIVEQMLKRPRE